MKIEPVLFPSIFFKITNPCVRRSFLTLPLPSLLISTPYTNRGGGSAGPPAILKTIAPMNVKFCRVLETFLKVLEMSKLST